MPGGILILLRAVHWITLALSSLEGTDTMTKHKNNPPALTIADADAALVEHARLVKLADADHDERDVARAGAFLDPKPRAAPPSGRLDLSDHDGPVAPLFTATHVITIENPDAASPDRARIEIPIECVDVQPGGWRLFVTLDESTEIDPDAAWSMGPAGLLYQGQPCSSRHFRQTFGERSVVNIAAVIAASSDGE